MKKFMLMKLALLKIALLRLLGVDELVRKAFYEGWQMAHDSDTTRTGSFHLYVGGDGDSSELDQAIRDTRCWRHVDEAWFNSDAEESV